MSLKQNVWPYLAGIAYASIFGFSFLFTKNAFDYINPIHFLALRFTLAALAMTGLRLLNKIPIDYHNKNLRPLLLLGLFQPILYFICESYGIKLTSSSQAGMMIALIPIMVTVLGALILAEYPSFKQLLCISFSVGGVLFIINMNQQGQQNSEFLGYLFLLGAVFSGAFFSVLSRKHSQQFNPFEITYIMMIMGAVVFNILAFGRQECSLNSYFAPLIHSEVIISLFYLSILSSIVAFALMNFTLSRIPALQASVFSNFVTVTSIIAGVLFRHEPFFWYHAVGALMILGGVWGTNYFGLKRQLLQGQKEQTIAK